MAKVIVIPLILDVMALFIPVRSFILIMASMSMPLLSPPVLIVSSASSVVVFASRTPSVICVFSSFVLAHVTHVSFLLYSPLSFLLSSYITFFITFSLLPPLLLSLLSIVLFLALSTHVSSFLLFPPSSNAHSPLPTEVITKKC